METAAKLIEQRDRLADELRRTDDAIRQACLAFGTENRMWGVSPAMLRRELRMRGIA